MFDSEIPRNMYGVTPNETEMSTHPADSIPIHPFAPTPARFVGRKRKEKEEKVDDDVRKRKNGDRE
jgi:hypothetical protein